MNILNLKFVAYGLVCIFQIMFIYTLAILLGVRLHRKLDELKLSMSTASHKAKKQYLLATLLQAFVPLIFIVLPLTAVLLGIILGIGSTEGKQLLTLRKQKICIHFRSLPLGFPISWTAFSW